MGMGWSVHFSFFCPHLENYYILFFNYFSSFKYLFLHIFWNIRRKKSEYSFFQNISPKSTTTFFSKIFTRIYQISRKLLNIFSSLFLVPYKSKNYIFWKKNQKKNRLFFMEFWKIFLISPISLKIGSLIVQDKYIC